MINRTDTNSSYWRIMAIDNSEAIAQAEERLASGIKSTSVDGTSVTHDDPKDARRELVRLKREDTTGAYSSRRRVQNINLGGF